MTNEINNHGRKNRKRKKASGVYRMEPLYQDADKSELVVGENTYYIDGKLGEFLIVSVPETTTQASAADLEQELAKVAKKPVLVISHNMTFLRATLLSRKELAELMRNAKEPEEPTDASSATE